LDEQKEMKEPEKVKKLKSNE